MRYNFACVLSGHLNDKEAAMKMLESTLAQARDGQVALARPILTSTRFATIRASMR